MGIAASSTKPIDEVFKSASDRAHDKNETIEHDRPEREDRDTSEIGERSLI